MSSIDDRLNRWQQRRVRRMSELSWLRVERPTDRPPVWYVADELLVREDHHQIARRVLAGQGHAARDVAEDEGTPGLRRYRADGLDVPRAARAVRHHARAAGDTRVAAGPNHVFVSAPFEHGGPFGPPVPAAAPSAWDVRLPIGRPVPVAVVDTGVWQDSPLPLTRYDATAADCESDVDVDDDGVIDGDVGHANFIAGVVVSNSPSSHVRVIRVLDTFGVCTEEELISALARVEDHRLVNLSLGGFTLDDEPPLALQDALASLLQDQGRVVVAAAGNDGQRTHPFWPAAFSGTAQAWSDRVVAVAAHDGTDVCKWSNTGDWVTLAAPGADVTSTYVMHKLFDTGWAQWSGTSFATPYVLAALAERMAAGESGRTAVAEVMRAAVGHSYGGYPGLP